MSKNNKKGFTIVELVIVIAVIAILAAVLIPTFSNIIKRANESADIQAVRNMNTYLAINEITEGKTIIDVYDALEKGGMTAKNYKPLTSDRYFFWDSTLNRILYTDDQYNVTFPEEYTTATKTNGWYSLSGQIPTVAAPEITNGIYEVSSAEQLYALSKVNEDGMKIKLTANIDLMGADVSFKNVTEFNGNYKTITGLVQLSAKTNTANSYETFTEKRTSGLISSVEGTVTDTVTIKDLTIDGAVVGDYDTGNVGILIGEAFCANVTISNVQINNSTVYGRQKVGGFVGYIEDYSDSVAHSITIDNQCSATNTKVYTSEAEAGRLVGAVEPYHLNFIFENNMTDTSGISVHLAEGINGRKVIKVNKTFTFNGKTTPTVVSLVQVYENNKLTGKYRMFFGDCLVTIANTPSVGPEGAITYKEGSSTTTTTTIDAKDKKVTIDGIEYTLKGCTNCVPAKD